MEKKEVTKIVIIAAVVLIVAIIFFQFIFVQKCKDISCFNTALVRCRKASFLDDATDAAWQYKIEGRSGNECVVNVKMLQAKQGTVDIVKIENLDMNCYVPYGSVQTPQQDLTRCHGLLKEGMQDLIIRKMHTYILEHLGEISEELEKAV